MAADNEAIRLNRNWAETQINVLNVRAAIPSQKQKAVEQSPCNAPSVLCLELAAATGRSLRAPEKTTDLAAVKLQ